MASEKCGELHENITGVKRLVTPCYTGMRILEYNSYKKAIIFRSAPERTDAAWKYVSNSHSFLTRKVGIDFPKLTFLLNKMKALTQRN